MMSPRRIAADLQEIAVQLESAGLGPREAAANLQTTRRGITKIAREYPRLKDPMLELARRIDTASKLASQLAGAMDAAAAQSLEVADIAAGRTAADGSKRRRR